MFHYFIILLTTFNNLNNNLGLSIISEWRPLLSLSIKMRKSGTFLNEYGNGSGSVYGQYILYIVQGGQKQHTLSYKMLCQQVKISSFSNVGRRKGPLGLVWILFKFYSLFKWWQKLAQWSLCRSKVFVVLYAALNLWWFDSEPPDF